MYVSLYESILKTKGNKVVIGKEEAGGWLGSLFEKDKMQVSELVSESGAKFS